MRGNITALFLSTLLTTSLLRNEFAERNVSTVFNIFKLNFQQHKELFEEQLCNIWDAAKQRKELMKKSKQIAFKQTVARDTALDNV